MARSMQFIGGSNPNNNDDWPDVVEVTHEDREPAPSHAWPWWMLFAIELIVFPASWASLALLGIWLKGIGLAPAMTVAIYIVAGICTAVALVFDVLYILYVTTEYRLRGKSDGGQERKKYVRTMVRDAAIAPIRGNPYAIVYFLGNELVWLISDGISRRLVLKAFEHLKASPH